MGLGYRRQAASTRFSPWGAWWARQLRPHHGPWYTTINHSFCSNLRDDANGRVRSTGVSSGTRSDGSLQPWLIIIFYRKNSHWILSMLPCIQKLSYLHKTWQSIANWCHWELREVSVKAMDWKYWFDRLWNNRKLTRVNAARRSCSLPLKKTTFLSTQWNCLKMNKPLY